LKIHLPIKLRIRLFSTLCLTKGRRKKKSQLRRMPKGKLSRRNLKLLYQKRLITLNCCKKDQDSSQSYLCIIIYLICSGLVLKLYLLRYILIQILSQFLNLFLSKLSADRREILLKRDKILLPARQFVISRYLRQSILLNKILRHKRLPL